MSRPNNETTSTTTGSTHDGTSTSTNASRSRRIQQLINDVYKCALEDPDNCHDRIQHLINTAFDSRKEEEVEEVKEVVDDAIPLDQPQVPLLDVTLDSVLGELNSDTKYMDVNNSQYRFNHDETQQMINAAIDYVFGELLRVTRININDDTQSVNNTQSPTDHSNHINDDNNSTTTKCTTPPSQPKAPPSQPLLLPVVQPPLQQQQQPTVELPVFTSNHIETVEIPVVTIPHVVSNLTQTIDCHITTITDNEADTNKMDTNLVTTTKKRMRIPKLPGGSRDSKSGPCGNDKVDDDNENDVPADVFEHVFNSYVAEVDETTAVGSKRRVVAGRIFWQNQDPTLKSKPYFQKLQRIVYDKLRLPRRKQARDEAKRKKMKATSSIDGGFLDISRREGSAILG